MESRQKSDISHLSRCETNASIMIPKDVFEKMYLTPQLPVKGQLRKTLGNPTPMSVSLSNATSNLYSRYSADLGFIGPCWAFF